MHPERIRNAELNSYEQYKSLGGIINEKDYANALTRAKNVKAVDSHALAQAQVMANVAGIALEDPEEDIDPRVALYAVLRGDTNIDREKHHHSQMSDQRLFAEMLRMLGDTTALKKFLAAHPHIFPEGK